MAIHVYPIDFASTTFSGNGGWSDELGSPRDDLEAIAISSAPPGRHHVDECAGFEREWRAIASQVIELVLRDRPSRFVWASGPIEPYGLLRVFPHMVADGSRTPYHIEGETLVDTDGYLTSWLSFAHEQSSFESLVKDNAIDLECVRLQLIGFDLGRLAEPGEQLKSLLETPFWKIGTTWLREHDAIAVSSMAHFEGCYVLAARSEIEKIIARMMEFAAEAADGR